MTDQPDPTTNPAEPKLDENGNPIVEGEIPSVITEEVM